jgi:hypothetical protein
MCRLLSQAKKRFNDRSDAGVWCRSKGDIVMRKMTTVSAFAFALALAGWSNVSYGASPANTTMSSTTGTARGAGVNDAYENPNVPGATGRTIVPGDHSTIAGDALATELQRTGHV